MSSLRQEIVDSKEGSHSLQDTVLGQKCLIYTLNKRMDKGSTAGFRGH